MALPTTLQSNRRMRESQVKDMAFGCDSLDCRCEAGTKYEEILDPSYWSNVATKMRQHTILNVRVDDCMWRAQLTVLSVGDNWVRVAPMLHVDLSEYAGAIPQKAEATMFIKFRGPRRWSVLRKEDAAVLMDDIGTEREAQEAMLSLEKQKAA